VGTCLGVVRSVGGCCWWEREGDLGNSACISCCSSVVSVFVFVVAVQGASVGRCARFIAGGSDEVAIGGGRSVAGGSRGSGKGWDVGGSGPVFGLGVCMAFGVISVVVVSLSSALFGMSMSIGSCELVSMPSVASW
jgi:hypothetical protein